MAGRLRSDQKELLLSVLKQSLKKPQQEDTPEEQEGERPRPIDKKLEFLNEAFKEAMRKSPAKEARIPPKKQFVDLPSQRASKVRDPMEDLGRQLGENAALFARNIAQLVALNVEELLYRRQ